MPGPAVADTSSPHPARPEVSPRSKPRWVERLKRWYLTAAVVLLNALLLLVVVNMSLSAVRYIRDRRPGLGQAALKRSTPLGRFGQHVLKAYPGKTEQEIASLIEEGRVAGFELFEYDPITQFRAKPFRGRYTNIAKEGFRLVRDQGPWPPPRNAINVFVFGGSTAFGSYVRDDETIASWLQSLAMQSRPSEPVFVYNFGQPGYISSQEGLLFYSLLLAGFVPDVAVFLDGLNDFVNGAGEPMFTQRLRRLMDGNDRRQTYGLADRLALVGALHSLRREPGEFRQAVQMDYQSEAFFDRVLSLWRANRRLVESIAKDFGVQSAFVWQPVPAYKYDVRHHMGYELYAGKPFPTHEVAFNYARMEGLRGELERNRNFLWLADMQEGRGENLYVDEVHYTAAFSRDIAQRICEFLDRQGFLRPTGAARRGSPASPDTP